ncbi:MAG: HDIG domain-containing protein [Bacteroidales bacterium]|jgi:putative nucleotidyltransferase with HDIG domain|nr:HDIG domain-containing protein [Bacteroidales bacterium]
MENLYYYIKRYYKIIFRAFLFAASVAIIVVLFPREGKFKYEFQKGKPWLHETLMAPFDFPIYKTDKQIQNEKDSILKFFNPYFVYDSSVFESELEKFRMFYHKKTNEYIESKFGKNDASSRKQGFLSNAKNFESFSIKIMTDVYSKGIIEISELKENLNIESRITLIKDKIAEDYSFVDFYTQKTAYEYVINNTDNYLHVNNVIIKHPEFYKSVNLYEFIVPNILYDAKTSDNIKETMLKNLSTSKGMVQEGERIISKGDVIDNNVYRILESLKHDFELKLGSSYHYQIILLGQIIFVFGCILVLFLFLLNFRKDILQHSLKTSFILMVVLLFVFIASVTLRISEKSIYIVPFALVPIIIKTFYDSRLALFIHFITVLLVGFFAPNGFEFVFLNFVAGIVAIFSLTNLYRRGKLFLSSALVVITLSIAYFGMAITQEGNIASIEWQNFIYFALNGALVLSSYPLIYIFEKVFGFLSDVRLMELSDTNQKLLRELAEKAPGTFQHSMQVANLAEEAIIKIGGNPLLVRTGAMYHDIGKLSNPIYFIENQRTGFNPHDMHEFDESADIIINHVREGIELARKNKLPKQLLAFIITHHGTGKVQYFYRSYIKKFPNKDVDISKFSYPGPKPNSKETAVLMMADSVEAASRSLTDYTDTTIDNLVESIINKHISDGQLDNSDVTFRDVTTIKAIFKSKIANIYHARIKYPEKI